MSETKIIFSFCTLNSFLGPDYPKDIINYINNILLDLFEPQISCGDSHSMVLTNKNEVYVWGRNHYGQLGLGDKKKRNKPTKLSETNFPHSINIKQIACGDNHSIALTNKNEIYVWGYNVFGQLGLGHYEDRNKPTKLDFDFPHSVDIKQIVVGGFHTIAITNKKEIYVWGNNDSGQLGLGDNINRNKPTKSNLSDIKQIICGGNHSIAITNENEIYVWGNNYYGELGLGDNINRNKPTKFEFSHSVDIKQIVCGYFHSMTLTNLNEIYVWGCNNFGQLGTGDYKHRNKPTKLNLPHSVDIKQIVCGNFHSMALTNTGKIYVWGYNNSGQLGLGDNIDRNKPTKLSEANFSHSVDIKQIICGNNHSIALTNKNEIYVWGYNYSGQLGLGDNENRNKPQKL